MMMLMVRLMEVMAQDVENDGEDDDTGGENGSAHGEDDVTADDDFVRPMRRDQTRSLPSIHISKLYTIHTSTPVGHKCGGFQFPPRCSLNVPYSPQHGIQGDTKRSSDLSWNCLAYAQWG